jgi:hypothetical protein
VVIITKIKQPSPAIKVTTGGIGRDVPHRNNTDPLIANRIAAERSSTAREGIRSSFVLFDSFDGFSEAFEANVNLFLCDV